jgi:hypothetical protein
MRYSFTSEFVKVVAPATNFGEAWELLCLHLLRADTGDKTILRLAPPDRILQQSTRTAYQCKSSERGVFGTIAAEPCIESINTAASARQSLGWEQYCLALNAPLTGSALAKVNGEADSLCIPRPRILPAEYWSELCEKHGSVAEHFLDYRVLVSEAEVLTAFEKARYFDRVVQSAAQSLHASPLRVELANNRTPTVLSIPFASDLTIEKLLDVAQQLMGIELDWVNFPDLGTSCGPSLSIAVGRKAQDFSRKLSELSDDERSRLQLWIKLVWKDELESKRGHIDGTKELFRMNLEYFGLETGGARVRDRGRETLKRTEALIQTAMWRSLTVDARAR